MSTPVQRINVVVKTTLLALALLVTLAGCTREGIFFLIAPKERVDVILPEKYEGPILIAYRVPDGDRLEKEGNVWKYRISEDGILLLQNPPLQTIGHYKFFYHLADGALQPIPLSTCFDDVEHDGVVVCSTGVFEIYNAQPLRPLVGYFVGNLDHWRRFKRSHEEFVSLYERYLNELVLPKD